MSLYVETVGSGEPLLMLHGWGMHGGIWNETAAQLAQHFQVHCVDLPGYGRSRIQDAGFITSDLESDVCSPGRMASSSIRMPGSGEGLLDKIVNKLSMQFDEPVSLCGWSLGGQIALRWAMRYPEQVERLVLVTSTPCFAEREDWQFGMPQHILQQFAADLEKNHAATLRRFLGLQVRGSEQERELLATLREFLFSRGEPDMDALRGGLEILRDADLRSALPQIKQTALVIAGERDKLTPPEASYYLAQTMPNARVVEIKGAAHAPFLSHRDEFVEQVEEFMEDKNN